MGKSELLFEKIEDSVIEAQVQKLLDTKKANEEANYKAKPIRENIEFDDFMKLDIRVGTVLECTKVPKADKLLQFRIDDGLEKRTIVSGIAQHYKPEDLVGKQVCFIANLAPRKLKGIVSEGMILSAENFDGKLAVITPEKEVKPGSEVNNLGLSFVVVTEGLINRKTDNIMLEEQIQMVDLLDNISGSKRRLMRPCRW